ncbi:MAG: M1 family metallopeptidase [Acidobacteriota bacterium]|nr:M1 family metallopeptidase [Acidobacteriota bacterium]
MCAPAQDAKPSGASPRSVVAQAPASFDPRITFAPLALPDPVNSFRSANGAPGPGYWQNKADYVMHASIDTEAKVLTNDEVITYTNNSPDTLPSLWIHLDQNIYRKDSRGANLGNGAAGPRPRQRAASGNAGPPAENHTEGFVIDSFEIAAAAPGARPVKADFLVDDTRMQVRLAAPMKPHSQLRLHIRYHYTITGPWGGRTSVGSAQHGEIYDIAQWYPRMCVYDDLRGWDTLPYIGAEFYLEYGDFDYSVTVPSSFIVAGGGELMNAAEVLTPKQIARLEQARHSDKTVLIRTPEETTDPASRPRQGGTLTWRFRMEHTRDVAFSASPTFVWDAAKVNLPPRAGDNNLPNALPAGKVPLAMSVYPVESVGPEGWSRSTEYLKDAVEEFSRRWFPYPYPTAINVAGFSTGMEYPGMAFDGIEDKTKLLFWITAHEIGHTWFPMIVGSNERRWAFMDEGFNTFVDTFESDDFSHGVYGPKRDSEYSAGGDPPDTILKVLDNPAAPNILTRADAFTWDLGHPVQYFKGAYGNTLLREQILGPERFDRAFRKYVRDWAYKHPSPSDFFREMASEGGEDLDFFWRGWYMHNWTLDLAVDSAAYGEGDPTGLLVRVSNRRPLVLPATLQVTYTDGSKERIRIPVEAWLNKTTSAFRFETAGRRAASVTVDPDHVLPDDDRSNDTLVVH